MVNVFSKASVVGIYESYPYTLAMESIWEMVAILCGTAFLAPVYGHESPERCSRRST